MDFFLQLMYDGLKSLPRTMCLFCLFVIPCTEQTRSFGELYLAEGGLYKALMIMGLPWVCILAHMTS